MDGYAVRAGDTPGVLPVVGHSAAGRPAPRSLGAGEAIEISTGAVVPDGADAVIPVERVVVRPTEIEIAAAVATQDNIRSRGGDVRAGDEVLAAGNVLTAARVGAHRRLRDRGDHGAPCAARRDPGHRLRAALAGRATRARSDLRVERDHARARARGGRRRRRAARARRRTRKRLWSRLWRARSRRMWLSPPAASRSGRTTSSAGSRRSLGVEEVFWGVAMRPGKPLAFGVRGATLVFGLPGQPALVARGSAALRHARAACSPGAPRAGAAVSAGSARPGGHAAARARRLCPRADLLERRPARSSTRSPGRSRT